MATASPPTPRVGRAGVHGSLEAASPRIAGGGDRLLDALVLALAAWTVAYHACVILGLGAAWAALLAVLVLGPLAWAARRAPAAEDRAGEHRNGTGLRAARPVCAAAAVAAAALFAFTEAPWWLVWALWVVAAGAAVAAAWGPRAAPPATHRPTWPATVTALSWALALAALSLFLVRPDGDDAQYVHLSTWVAAHGVFPVRDIIFTDQQLPAIFYPPLSSFEGLLGTLARATSIPAPDLVYLAVPPVASGLAVLAMWRLLRRWGVPLAGTALSATILFLLFYSDAHKTLGSLFVGRIWQGKVIFLAVLVPLLFALIDEYAARPGRQRLVLLAAAGAAAVGLTSTAVFVVPVVAAAGFAPLAVRAPRRAAAGFAATAAYPLAAAAVAVIGGTRNAQEYVASEVGSERLLHLVLGDGPLAFAALAAVLAGPLLVPRTHPRRMASASVVLAAVLFAPSVPLAIFDLTGLGQVLWRLVWAIPVAALVGTLAAAAIAHPRPPALKAGVAALGCVALVACGVPVWTSSHTGPGIESRPSWKRWPEAVEDARTILGVARPGDVVLAPTITSETMLIMSGDITTVAPRAFYARALTRVEGGRAQDRLRLTAFTRIGLGRVEGKPHWADGLRRRTIDARGVRKALRAVGVDLACLWDTLPDAKRVVEAAGYRPVGRTDDLSCFRRPPS